VSSDYNIRCSAVVVRKHAVLLVHRTRDDLDDWVLPGGSPREGESLADLKLHPGLAGHLKRLADPRPHGYAAYVGNAWRPEPGPPS
jgi:8-oxo-dGTP pyrophosphatase MutT (NUDIX family)